MLSCAHGNGCSGSERLRARDRCLAEPCSVFVNEPVFRQHPCLCAGVVERTMRVYMRTIHACAFPLRSNHSEVAPHSAATHACPSCARARSHIGCQGWQQTVDADESSARRSSGTVQPRCKPQRESELPSPAERHRFPCPAAREPQRGSRRAKLSSARDAGCHRPDAVQRERSVGELRERAHALLRRSCACGRGRAGGR
jgi:hypothetical protein